MKTFTLSLLSVTLLINGYLSHMALSEPAPRRSPHHPKYSEPEYDYDILSPLGGEFTFPCRGAAPGPVYKSYQAGGNIAVNIEGNTKHLGGHCQFSISYDNKNFVTLKTVMGNCISATTQYTVDLPSDLPQGKATFAWTWLNREGNREFYMNCVDIEIQNSSNRNGKFTGKKMLVGNLMGGPTFPEFFSDSFGKEYFENQPTISIGPDGSSGITDPEPVPSPKPTPSQKPKPTSSPKPRPSSKPQPSSSATTVIDNPNPKPTPAPVPGKDKDLPNPKDCVNGSMYCMDNNTIAMCWLQQYYPNKCADGTTCKGKQGSSACV